MNDLYVVGWISAQEHGGCMLRTLELLGAETAAAEGRQTLH